MESPLGRVVLVSGPESLLADRAVATLLKRLRGSDPAIEISEIEADRLDAGRLVEMTSASLFSTLRAAVIWDLANLPAELTDDIVALAAEPVADLAVVLVHGGGVKGKALLDKLKKMPADRVGDRINPVQVIDCSTVKAWELPQFVAAEVKRARATIDSSAAQFLVDAVGHDLRLLAAAVTQLLADGDGLNITLALVKQYFGGRSEVTSFGVADAALSGRTGVAMEQLRWAMSTGVAPVLVTSALASGLRGVGKLITAGTGLHDADLAREVGVPPWKLRSIRSQARGWDSGGVAAALKVVATADAEVKGAAVDAEYSLERALIAIARARHN